MPPGYQEEEAFTCGVCLEDQSVGSPYVTLAGDTVCKACYESELVPRFEEALNVETSYPVSWGPSTLDPRELPGFTEDFLSKWTRRIEEYAVPRSRRVYCKHLVVKDIHGDPHFIPDELHVRARIAGVHPSQCGAYLGVVNPSQQEKTVCVCYGMTCCSCGKALLLSQESEERHTCEPQGASTVDEEDNIMIRGLDYQQCPQCEIRVGLVDGCNTIFCTCRTHFCFLCGVRAHHDSDHWARGKDCPRWGRPESGRGMHDDDANPLVIAQVDLNIARFMRELAATAPDERARELRLDEALLADILGNARARRLRAAAQGLPLGAGNWYDALSAFVKSFNASTEVYDWAEQVQRRDLDEVPFL